MPLVAVCLMPAVVAFSPLVRQIPVHQRVAVHHAAVSMQMPADAPTTATGEELVGVVTPVVPNTVAQKKIHNYLLALVECKIHQEQVPPFQ